MQCSNGTSNFVNNRKCWQGLRPDAWLKRRSDENWRSKWWNMSVGNDWNFYMASGLILDANAEATGMSVMISIKIGQYLKRTLVILVERHKEANINSSYYCTHNGWFRNVAKRQMECKSFNSLRHVATRTLVRRWLMQSNWILETGVDDGI